MNPVYLSNTLSEDLPKYLADLEFSSLFVLTDENTQIHCLPQLHLVLPEETVHFTVSAGEKHKNLSTCSQIWEAMTQAGLDRKALVLNLGGGVLGDMGGFCASIYKRGIRFVNLPTTLLSQVDASVGGKLGVDFEGLKNHLGVFREPEWVLIAPQFLDTLPRQELRSGYAEILKHGLIQDASYFSSLAIDSWESSSWEKLILRSVEIKKSVVQADPQEKGLRKILNFGHTIGHAMETHFLDGPNHLLHGEAIAAGMICEAWLSVQKTGLQESDLELIQHSLLSIYGKITLQEADLEPIVNLCLQDKKNEGESMLFSLLHQIGECLFNLPVRAEEIRNAIRYYQSL